MKKLFLTFMTCAALASVTTFTACSDDDNSVDNGGVTNQTEELSGTITGTKTLDAKNEYFLTGTLIVPDGATLEIPAGTTIKAKQGFGNYILVAQGGKIKAEGTADKPIIFTADKEDAGSGYWGGLIINGKAPISGTAASGNVGATEINNDYKYGGDNVADNSGVLKYVELRYTGARSNAEIEHNGLTLNGVGNGTVIENLYITDGADDAIEFFGGSVNVTNLLVVNCEDDMFDFTQGYTGTVTNCYGIWKNGFTSDEADPRGVEADGNLDGAGPDHKNQSDFQITDMTIETASTDGEIQDAIKIRRGAKATIKNALVKGAGKVGDLIDMTDKKGNGSTESSISLTNELVQAISGKEIALGEGETNENLLVANGNTGADASKFAWTKYDFSGNETTTEFLSGVIKSSVSLDASKEYIINGSVIVEDGGTLTIPAGMTIKAKKGFSNYILVAKGGKIMAEGTAEKPIVFTADVDNAGSGYWGGIILNGKALISGTAETGNEGATEINNDYKYGGSDDKDNSGTLTYVSILYTGARSNAEIEHNGLTLNAVGSGTTIENIYIAEGADDAIEFFGGSVDVTNLLVVNCEDDMFDFTQGYSGTLKNCYGIWEAAFISDEADPRGVEADGNLDGAGPDHKHQSDFKIENMTVDNRATDAEMQDVIKIRRGAKATITNALVKGAGKCIDLVDMTDKKGDGNVESTISLTNGLTSAFSGKEVNGTAHVTVAEGNTGADNTVFTWCGYKF